MEHDGNGWVHCALGHKHWGRHGAAGLLLHCVDDDGVARVLLQHRADWSHHGDTWGMPGGARDSHEDATAAALREAAEETGLDAGQVRVRHHFLDDHGGWAYTTVYADTPAPLPTEPNRESVALTWVALDDVRSLTLHPGFAHTWGTVAATPATLLVDAANVVGSRPDGWWRDRAGAAGRLLAELGGLRAVVTRNPSGVAVVARVVAVLEGAARDAASGDGWAEVVRAAGSGDDTVVEQARRLARPGSGAEPVRGHRVVVVTADRELRRRVLDAAPSAELAGPGWLHALLAERPLSG